MLSCSALYPVIGGTVVDTCLYKRDPTSVRINRRSDTFELRGRTAAHTPLMKGNLSRLSVTLLAASKRLMISAIIERKSTSKYSCLIPKVEVAYVQNFGLFIVQLFHRLVLGMLQDFSQ